MVVYADILVVLNFIVDYFLIYATSNFIRRNASVWRSIAGAMIGGLSSLYIFLPVMSVFADVVYKIFVCAVTTLVVFGFLGIKQYLKAVAVLLGVTCAYGGIMIAVLHIFNPQGMLISNSVVYFNISPLVLVIATTVAYLLFTLLFGMFKRSSPTAKECEVTVFARNEKIRLSAIADTGNSLTDTFGKSEIIIADKSVISALFGETDIENNAELALRYRVVPCSTVSGEGIMQGFRCDRAEVFFDKKSLSLENPIIAVSETPLKDGFNAIINPEILY